MMSFTKFSVSATTLKRFLNFYPPLIGAGIKVKDIRNDFRYARVCMPLTFYNRNYVNTQYGGSLYSMTDPFYMLMLLNVLGKEFIVWDKAGSIEYRKPGRGTVTAEFMIDDELLRSIQTMKPREVKIVDLPVDVKDEQGEIVAHVVKTEYIRRKGDSTDQDEINEE